LIIDQMVLVGFAAQMPVGEVEGPPSPTLAHVYD
jgi:hypothetical protein